jgi:hypothetical protein
MKDSSWRRWLQPHQMLRDSILGTGLRQALDRITALAATRYSAEVCKDVAAATVAGLVAGLVVARFSSWMPTPQGWELVLGAVLFACVLFILGVALVFAASAREKADAGNEHAAALDWWGKWLARAVWVMLLLIAVAILWGLHALSTPAETFV